MTFWINEEVRKISEPHFLSLLYNKNKSKSADDIFNCVHDELRAQDAALLKCAVQYINFLHKGGLLHQAANSLGRAVIWDKNVTDDDVKALMS